MLVALLYVLADTVLPVSATVLCTTAKVPQVLHKLDLTDGSATTLFTLNKTLFPGLYYQTAFAGYNSDKDALYSFFVNTRQGLKLANLDLVGGNKAIINTLGPPNAIWSEQHQPEAIVWVNIDAPTSPACGHIYTTSFWDTPKDPRPRSIRVVDTCTWAVQTAYEWPLHDGTHFLLGTGLHIPQASTVLWFLTKNETHYMHFTSTTNPTSPPVLVNLSSLPLGADQYPGDYVWNSKEGLLWATTTFNFKPGLVKVDIKTGKVMAASQQTFAPADWAPAEGTKPCIDPTTGYLVLTLQDPQQTHYLVSVDSNGQAVLNTTLSVSGLSSFGCIAAGVV